MGTVGTQAPNLNLDLKKGHKIDLTKENPGLTKLSFGMGWDANSGNGDTMDLDAFALALGADGKLATKDEHSILYFKSPKDVNGKLHIFGGALLHTGDNLTGAGDGDDETINADLALLPADVHEVLICVNIYQADAKHQNFGMVKNAFIRGYNTTSPIPDLLKYELSEDFSTATIVKFGKIYRRNGEWKFEAIGEGLTGSIADAAQQYM